MQEQNKLTREEQTEVTRVLVKTAQMLASCGAESRIIEQTTCRLGKTLTDRRTRPPLFATQTQRLGKGNQGGRIRRGTFPGFE